LLPSWAVIVHKKAQEILAAASGKFVEVVIRHLVELALKVKRSVPKVTYAFP
jgi:hypothetical protein